ncbi:MAG: DNA gyrase subunit A [Candidatus Woesearchaeota archaeon]|nr:MAG: DNA gyrase subunit A [Candidatus Woesearchaeota archaeon]
MVDGSEIADREGEKNVRIIDGVLEEEMKKSFLDYAMSVIISRALPDARDGLKPVHRRILFAMHEMGIKATGPHKKSARIVGEVLGKFHPHGDQAVYDSLVRMAQDFSLRYPLIDGQGNWGSVDGDRAAAMRYTEARLRKVAEELLVDIEKETVAMADNFDASLVEPLVLPSKLPHLLINGGNGIAVGMATSIPPHNLKEINTAVIALLQDKDISDSELFSLVTGPDFPTGGIIKGTTGILSAYKTGRGKAIVIAKHHMEEIRGKKAIVFTEIPYQLNKATLVEAIADQVKDKIIEGITDLRDESSRKGMRIVIELRKDAHEETVLNQLFKHTRLRDTFSMILLSIINGVPQVANLRTLLQVFIDHRIEVITKRTQYELRKAQERAHILEGLLIALKDIDGVIKLIKASESAATAKIDLIERYRISEIQAKEILEMKLQKLANLEQEKIRSEHKELMDRITELQGILDDTEKVNSIIVEELTELTEKYGDERRTLIEEDELTDIDMEDLIEPEDMVVTITRDGYIKRISPLEYRTQRRGGKGVTAQVTKDDDNVVDLFYANTHSFMLFFTSKGRVYWKKVYALPEGSRYAKGKHLVNLLSIAKDEKVTSVLAVREFNPDEHLVMVTKNGTFKKTSLSAYSRPRQGGIIAITLDDGDEVVDVLRTSGTDTVMIATRSGFAVKFDEADVRSIGRTSRGVRGISLRANDYVIGMRIVKETDTLLTITENGFGKRSKVADYRKTNRGSKGVINIVCSERNGPVAAVNIVEDADELLLISRQGIMIRIGMQDIPLIGRNTQGVRIMRLGTADAVVSSTKICA